MIDTRMSVGGTSVLPVDGPLCRAQNGWRGRTSHLPQTLHLVAPNAGMSEAALAHMGYVPTNRFVLHERREVRLYAAPMPMSA